LAHSGRHPPNSLTISSTRSSSKQPDDLVYEITKALWSEKTRAALDAGHAKGKAIQKDTALLGVGIPLHAGAERYYKEAGLLK
jgi:TRAP-type uncharacterized transport system substrate-binding protein